VASVLSGNRNFEGRVNQDVRANYLASPPLVVAYALAGSVYANLETDPLGTGKDGQPVYLRDIWPTNAEIEQVVRTAVTKEMFADALRQRLRWRSALAGHQGRRGPHLCMGRKSTYVQNPPYFEGMSMTPTPPRDVVEARVLGLFGDSITTDHISPAGSIKKVSPAGAYLTEHGVAQADFNSYGARRGNHEVMMRGTFANIRIKNQMVKNDDGSVVEGGFTIHQPVGRADVHLRRRHALSNKKAANSSSSPAKNTAPAHRATGPPRAPRCSASAPSWPRASSASTART
jgi:aconitate hydratase